MLHGSLKLGTTTGLTITGNGTASVSVSGLLSALKTALPSLVYTPKTGYSGADTFSLTILDSTDQAKGVAALTAIKVNPLPAVKASSLSQREREWLRLSFRESMQSAWSIPRAQAAMPETLTLAVLHGSLKFGTTTGLTITGNGTASVSVSGLLSALKTALPTLVYTPKTGYSGADTFSLTILDTTDQAKGVAAQTSIKV